MKNEITQALYGNAVEHLITAYVNAFKPEDLLRVMESDAVDLLSQIKAILDDDTMEDPQCFQRIDKIVSAFGAKGIYTPRHDW